MGALRHFALELEKLSYTKPIKGAKGRRNKDGVARVSKPLPEPPGSVPKAPAAKKRATLNKLRAF